MSQTNSSSFLCTGFSSPSGFWNHSDVSTATSVSSIPKSVPTVNYSKALRRMPLTPDSPLYPASPGWKPLTKPLQPFPVGILALGSLSSRAHLCPASTFSPDLALAVPLMNVPSLCAGSRVHTLAQGQGLSLVLIISFLLRQRGRALVPERPRDKCWSAHG